MPQFIYRIRPTRADMLRQGANEQEAAFIGQHFDYLESLTRRGVVLLAGRTLSTDDDAFGIVVFATDSESAARAVMHDDPAVRAGVMQAQLWPFRVALWSPQGPRGDDGS